MLQAGRESSEKDPKNVPAVRRVQNGHPSPKQMEGI